MVRWKADRARILAQVVQAQGLRLADQDAENAAPTREVADRRMRLGVDAGRQEALELRAAAVDHPEGSVAGAREVGGGPDQALEEHVERQLRRDRDARLEEGT